MESRTKHEPKKFTGNHVSCNIYGLGQNLNSKNLLVTMCHVIDTTTLPWLEKIINIIYFKLHFINNNFFK